MPYDPSDVQERCRICGEFGVAIAGKVEYIIGYLSTIYDCALCGCRFTHHVTVHDLMHKTGAISYYSDYKAFASKCQVLFKKRDAEGLRDLLCTVSKYRFIIDTVGKEQANASILEIGSSRGYLTSYFILVGRNILGVDISPQAVSSARAHYGDHFAVPSDPIMRCFSRNIIYHVGTIGCVADPVGLTQQLLASLPPGGKLFFNAPNREALQLVGQLWLDTAPPPDLVTLFPPGFWKKRFSDMAHVSEEIELVPREQAFLIGTRQLCRKRWLQPEAKRMRDADESGHVWSQSMDPPTRFLERSLLWLARATGLLALTPSRPAEFGIFVTMIRK